MRQKLARSSLVVIGRAFVDDARLQVILQVFADAGELMHQRNVEAAQQSCGPDAGDLEQLRRLQRAGAKQTRARARRVLGAATTIADAAGAAPVERDPCRLRAGLDAEVLPPARRLEVATAVLQRQPRRVDNDNSRRLPAPRR